MKPFCFCPHRMDKQTGDRRGKGPTPASAKPRRTALQHVVSCCNSQVKGQGPIHVGENIGVREPLLVKQEGVLRRKGLVGARLSLSTTPNTQANETLLAANRVQCTCDDAAEVYSFASARAAPRWRSISASMRTAAPCVGWSGRRRGRRPWARPASARGIDRWTQQLWGAQGVVYS